MVRTGFTAAPSGHAAPATVNSKPAMFDGAPSFVFYAAPAGATVITYLSQQKLAKTLATFSGRLLVEHLLTKPSITGCQQGYCQ